MARSRLVWEHSPALAGAPTLQSARFGLLNVRLLPPPYTAFMPWRDGQEGGIPLGTVLHGCGRSAFEVLCCVAVALRTCPWLVPVITLPRHEAHLASLIDVVDGMLARAAVTTSCGDCTVVDSVAVVTAARHRSPPTYPQLSDYVAIRVSAQDLRDAVAEQFCEARQPSAAIRRSAATYCRIFGRYGPYTARDWRALARLAYEMATSSARPAVRSPSRALECCARRFTGMSFCRGTQYLGWEWVLESGLRRGGFVPVDGAVLHR